MNTDPGFQERRIYQTAFAYGLTLVAGMIVFAGAGIWLDGKRDSSPLWTLTGVGMGFLFGIYETWKLYRQLNKTDHAEND